MGGFLNQPTWRIARRSFGHCCSQSTARVPVMRPRTGHKRPRMRSEGGRQIGCPACDLPPPIPWKLSIRPHRQLRRQGDVSSTLPRVRSWHCRNANAAFAGRSRSSRITPCRRKCARRWERFGRARRAWSRIASSRAGVPSIRCSFGKRRRHGSRRDGAVAAAVLDQQLDRLCSALPRRSLPSGAYRRRRH